MISQGEVSGPCRASRTMSATRSTSRGRKNARASQPDAADICFSRIIEAPSSAVLAQ